MLDNTHRFQGLGATSSLLQTTSSIPQLETWPEPAPSPPQCLGLIDVSPDFA